MEVVLRYSKASLAEFGSITRKWHYWPRMLLGRVRVLVYLGVGLFVGFNRLLKGFRATPVNRDDLQTGALILLGICAVFALLLYLQAMKARKALAAQGERTLKLDNSGVTNVTATGATTFEPWTTFQDFRWGKTLAVLSRAKPGSPLGIPFDALSPEQTGALRSTLLGHLPERT